MASAYSGGAGKPVRLYASAPANEVEEWALGKLKRVGVLVSAGKSASSGRALRTTSFSAVLAAYAPATAP